METVSIPGPGSSRRRRPGARHAAPRPQRGRRGAPGRPAARLAALLLVAGLVAACGGPDGGTSADPALERAAGLLAADRPSEAFDLLQEHVERNPGSADGLVLFAETCQRLGRVRRGVRAVEKALSLEPEHPRGHYVSALLERDRHHPADAIASARRAAALAPQDVEVALLLGDLLLAAAENEAAVEAFAAARALAPENPRAVAGHGQALVLVGRHREGLPLLESYLGRHPQDPQAFYLRGLARLREKELEAAEQDFRRAITLAPYLPGPYHNLARILQMTGREEEAATVRERHREVNERDWAIRGAQRRLAGDPRDAETARELARLLREAGRTEEAARVLRRYGGR